jgi:hypothetical protein
LATLLKKRTRMPNYWDSDFGQSYDWNPSDSFEDILEKERRKREAEERAGADVLAPPPEIPQMRPMQEEEEGPDYRSPIQKGIMEAGDWAWDKIKGVATSPIPYAKEYGEWAGEHPIASKAVSLPLDMALRGGADVLGMAQEGEEAAVEAYKDPRAEVPYHDKGPVSDVMRAIGAGYEAGTTPEALARTEERRPELMGEVADIPEVVDAAAIALIPWTVGGSTASRLALWTNRVGRSVDALDATIGAEQLLNAEGAGDYVAGTLRLAGGGLGAGFGGMKFVPDEAAKFADEVNIPAVDDVARQMDLEAKGAREGLTDAEYRQLEELELQMPDETVQPFGQRAPENVAAYEAARGEGPELPGPEDMWGMWGAEVTPNASLESAASAEAMSRQAGMSSRGERFVVYDRAGNARPLIGPEAVDYQVRPGETYGIEGPDGFRTLDDAGGVVPPVVMRPKERGSIEFGGKEPDEVRILQDEIDEIESGLGEVPEGGWAKGERRRCYSRS